MPFSPKGPVFAKNERTDAGWNLPLCFLQDSCLFLSAGTLGFGFGYGMILFLKDCRLKIFRAAIAVAALRFGRLCRNHMRFLLLPSGKACRIH